MSNIFNIKIVSCNSSYQKIMCNKIHLMLIYIFFPSLALTASELKLITNSMKQYPVPIVPYISNFFFSICALMMPFRQCKFISPKSHVGSIKYLWFRFLQSDRDNAIYILFLYLNVCATKHNIYANSYQNRYA